MEKTILRQKIAARPPDIYIAPEIVDIQMLAFYKADEIFQQAQSAKDQLRRELESLLDKSRSVGLIRAFNHRPSSNHAA